MKNEEEKSKKKLKLKVAGEDASVVEVKYSHFSPERDEKLALIRNKLERILNNQNNSEIVSFRKVKDKNYVKCTLEDGTSEIIPVDQSLQLLLDKIEMSSYDTKEITGIKDRIEIRPFQNKVFLIEGLTGKVKKEIDIDKNLMYVRTDSKTGSIVKFDSRLNPAILAILADDLQMQSDFANGIGNVNVVYNFDAKSEKAADNISNKKIVKKMNNYYKSEMAYAQEMQQENIVPNKLGYANFTDKIQTTLSNIFRKKEPKALKDSFDAKKVLTDRKKDFDKRIFVDKSFLNTKNSQKTVTQNIKSKNSPNGYRTMSER